MFNRPSSIINRTTSYHLTVSPSNHETLSPSYFTSLKRLSFILSAPTNYQSKIKIHSSRQQRPIIFGPLINQNRGFTKNTSNEQLTMHIRLKITACARVNKLRRIVYDLTRGIYHPIRVCKTNPISKQNSEYR